MNVSSFLIHQLKTVADLCLAAKSINERNFVVFSLKFISECNEKSSIHRELVMFDQMGYGNLNGNSAG